MTITFAPARDILVASSIPGANEALAAGYAARDAQRLADYMAAEHFRREARPLPEGGRELRWALENREQYAAKCEQQDHKAASLAEQYERRLATVRGISPATAEAIETAAKGN